MKSSGEPAIAALVDRYLASLAAGRRPSTLRHARDDLRRFAEWLDARNVRDARLITRRDLEAYQAALAEHRYHWSKAPAEPSKSLAMTTRYARLLSVVLFCRWLTSERVLLADPSAGLALGWAGRALPRRVLSESDVAKMLEAPDPDSPQGLRDRAILELFYSTGLRRAELARLELADIDLTGGTVFVRSGKGDKSRLVPLGQVAARALLAYLERGRPAFLVNPGTTALFLAGDHGACNGRRLGEESMLVVVQRAARAAGLAGRVSPHVLRHSVATHLLRAGAGIRHVQELLGHASVETTEVYTHLTVRDLIEAHARSHPRGRSRRPFPVTRSPKKTP